MQHSKFKKFRRSRVGLAGIQCRYWCRKVTGFPQGGLPPNPCGNDGGLCLRYMNVFTRKIPG